MAKRAKVKAKSLVSRLSGFSILGFGASWKPSELDRAAIRKLIVILEDKRALYVSYDQEVRAYVNQSMHEIRSALTDALQNTSDDSPAQDSLRIMRAACRAFDTAVSNREHHHRYTMEQEYYMELGRLRAIFGQQIAVLAYLYDVDVEEGLVTILPPVAK